MQELDGSTDRKNPLSRKRRYVEEVPDSGTESEEVRPLKRVNWDAAEDYLQAPEQNPPSHDLLLSQKTFHAVKNSYQNMDCMPTNSTVDKNIVRKQGETATAITHDLCVNATPHQTHNMSRQMSRNHIKSYKLDRISATQECIVHQLIAESIRRNGTKTKKLR